ncbi:hypothetical protein ZHAS_00012094 [Anopheles sinensis]|uniref:Uncharacterized protein n=1 Tax=Anopheles sinensis TaxID=74873 RepID=A0A084W1W7_ANOSI|nr:hypothetical protein ZHAS_00012094 [Anopheles sinensis]
MASLPEFAFRCQGQAAILFVLPGSTCSPFCVMAPGAPTLCPSHNLECQVQPASSTLGYRGSRCYARTPHPRCDTRSKIVSMGSRGTYYKTVPVRDVNHGTTPPQPSSPRSHEENSKTATKTIRKHFKQLVRNTHTHSRDNPSALGAGEGI